MEIDLKLPPRPPGFAFVEFAHSRDAQDAVDGRDGYDFYGSRLRVRLCSTQVARRVPLWLRVIAEQLTPCLQLSLRCAATTVTRPAAIGAASSWLDRHQCILHRAEWSAVVCTHTGLPHVGCIQSSA